MFFALVLIFPIISQAQHLIDGSLPQRYAIISGHEILFDNASKSYKVVLPDGQFVSPTDFFKGKIGTEFNYCSDNGYKTKVVKLKGKPITKSFCYKDDGTRKSIARLAYEKGDYNYLYGVGIGAPPPPDSVPDPPEDPDPPDPGDPPQLGDNESFDWRDVDGVNYLHDPVDQGCRNCYAHQGVTLAQTTVRIATNNQIIPDFDEVFLTNCAKQYHPLIYGCEQPPPFGIDTIARWDHLKMMTEVGMVIDDDTYIEYQDDCYPYKWYYRPRMVFNDLDTIPQASSDSLMALAIINHLENIGPVAADVKYALDNSIWYNYQVDSLDPGEVMYANDVSYDDILTGNRYITVTNFEKHAIVIIGYGYLDCNEGNYLYWIVQNSQDPDGWGAHGIGFINYYSFEILDHIAYLEYQERNISPWCYYIGEATNGGDLDIFNVPLTCDSIWWKVYASGTQSLSSIVTPNYGNDQNALFQSINGTVNGEIDLVYYMWYDDDGAYVPQSCPQAEFTDSLVQTYWIGPPLTPVIVNSDPNPDPCDWSRTYQIQNSSEDYYATNVNWSSDGGINIVGSTTGETCDITVGYPGGNLYCELNNTGSDSVSASYITIPFDCPNMMVYPNPTDDFLDIEVDNILDDSDIDTSLFNSKGEKRKEKTTKLKKHNLDVSDLLAGTYYLKVKLKNKNGQDVILEETVVIM